MRRILLISPVMATLVLFGSADAQTCSGLASFAHGPWQVFGTAGFADNVKSFGGGLSFGGTGAFGQVNLGTASYDNVDGSSLLYGGGAGYQIPLGQKRLAHLCPTASIGLASGPNNVDVFGDGSLVLDLSETDLSFGVSLGVLASQSPQTQIIPTGSLSFVSATLKASDDVSGASDSQTETFGLLGLGIGFVFNQVVTVRPSVSIPFGLDGASTTFAATFSVNFGGKPVR